MFLFCKNTLFFGLEAQRVILNRFSTDWNFDKVKSFKKYSFICPKRGIFRRLVIRT